MRRLLGALAVLCCAALPAAAGPNAGGVLLVHDTGLAYSTDTPGPPYGGMVPSGCADVDIQAALDAPVSIWKAYAAFPAGSSPRLQGISWGINLTPHGGGYISMAAGGQVQSSDFEITQDGWPTTDGASIGQSFPVSGTKTTLMTEVYWFAGYAYGGPSGTDGQYFCAQPHSVQASMFVDDAAIKNKDPIADYGCLGFGGPGHVHCPQPVEQSGRCCYPDGSCAVSSNTQCTGTWTFGLNCSPNMCRPAGACCYADGTCTSETLVQCGSLFGAYQGNLTICVPNPCPPPTGSCCLPSGTCSVTAQTDCAGAWIMYGICIPNTCPQPSGSCCPPNGMCSATTQEACTGTWTEAALCSPNPCLQPTGAFDLVAPAVVAQGALVTITVTASNTAAINGYGINFTFDPAVFEFFGSTLVGTRGEGAVSFMAGQTVSSARAGVVYGYACEPGIPAGSGPLLFVTLRVKPDAPGGDTQVVLEDQSPTLNRMGTCGGGTIVPSLSARGLLVLPSSGSCCAPNGICTVTTQAACGGIWTAGGTCAPNACAQTVPGACCSANACRVFYKAYCERLRGVFYGGVCRPDPCPRPFGRADEQPNDGPPVEKDSWGQIKNRYR